MSNSTIRTMLTLASFFIPWLAQPAQAEKLVLQDSFSSSQLDSEWTWLREHPEYWRMRDGALEIRVEPGKGNTVRNALLRKAPDRSKGTFAVEVTVRNLSVPSQQFEQAGITWYHGGRPVFKLVKELVDGQLMIIPGRKPMTAESVRLRLVVDADSWTAQYQPDAKGPFLEAAKGKLPPPGEDQVSIQCYNGPPDAEHWIRFDDFRIVQLSAKKTTAGNAATDKTLVSWVELDDLDVRAGSALTIQNDDAFDGIVFAELSPDRWMAGSNSFRRSNRGQRDVAPVEKSRNELIQVAVVYQGDTITLYRNGEVYHSYRTENIDLLSQQSNFVVFGLRHSGGNGALGGSIEDARIYDKALTVGEIRSLEPNEESSIKPYAWWDFHGDKFVDRTGRYPHGKLAGATLRNGQLVLGKNAMACAARTEEVANRAHRRGEQPKFIGPYVPETPKWPASPPDNWPTYHLAHPTSSAGSPFDPNPALFHKGRYHLHYIYRPPAGFAFAHVSSTDMVHWKWHPTVLAPPTTGHGMFSGTGFFTKDGQPAMVYHGQGSNRNWILYAQDDSLDKWSEPQVMLPRDKDGKLMEDVRYFDPDIWRMGDMYYGLNGVSSREPPQIMKSADLKEWTFIGEFLHPDFDEEKLGVEKSEDISCPNVFKLGEKWVLVCISHRLGCRYFIGDFQNEQFLPEQHALLGGNSKRYFAPESLLTPDGRRINWAWFFGGGIKGVQSLPTELELPPDGILRMRPIRELESLRYHEQTRKSIPRFLVRIVISIFQFVGSAMKAPRAFLQRA